MKGDITKAILKRIGETTVDVWDVFGAYLDAGYGASYSKLTYFSEKRKKDRVKRKVSLIREKRYKDLLYRLEKDGLLKKIKKNKKEYLKLTGEGKKKSKKTELSKIPSPSNYKGIPSEKYTIIIFDIPEEEKRKRAWLRRVLVGMDFSMIQKSVWAGKLGVPESFIKSIFDLELNRYVHIFEAVKLGSLSEYKRK